MIWFAIPSANAPKCSATFAKWKARGYMTAVLVDGYAPEPQNADLVVRVETYPGYGASVNTLCSRLKNAEWVVTGGDDVYPADKPPEQIAAECIEHAKGTFCLMQPGGPRHCAVSPWMGKEFRRRANRGNGPYWPAYGHYFDDGEIQAIAEREHCFWYRDDIMQFHDHWSLRTQERPAYLEKAAAGWRRARDLFEERNASGFPGSEFLV